MRHAPRKFSSPPRVSEKPQLFEIRFLPPIFRQSSEFGSQTKTALKPSGIRLAKLRTPTFELTEFREEISRVADTHSTKLLYRLFVHTLYIRMHIQILARKYGVRQIWWTLPAAALLFRSLRFNFVFGWKFVYGVGLLCHNERRMCWTTSNAPWNYGGSFL